jgi:hypothetical protein
MAVDTSVVVALAELARQVRASTLQMLDVPREWLTWTPAGTSNHILWHAGHALWLQDVLSMAPLTNRSQLPSGWAAMFGQSSRPAETAAWPDRVEVAGHLEAQLREMLQIYAKHAEEIVSYGNKRPRGNGWPLLDGILHGWHDEARHQGEMYLLFKLCRAQQRI